MSFTNVSDVFSRWKAQRRAQIIVEFRFPVSETQFVGRAISGQSASQIDRHVDMPIGRQGFLGEHLDSLFGGKISRNDDDVRSLRS